MNAPSALAADSLHCYQWAEYFRLLQAALMHHPFAELLGLSVAHKEPGASRCVLPENPRLRNPHGVVHGAAMYALADTGMGAALYTLLAEGEYCATIEIKITYFKAVREGELECLTRLLHRGKRVAALESEILHRGALIAKASGSFAIFQPDTP
jgi:acyl-CoA thioesterase